MYSYKIKAKFKVKFGGKKVSEGYFSLTFFIFDTTFRNYKAVLKYAGDDACMCRELSYNRFYILHI